MDEFEWSHEILPGGGQPLYDGGPRVSTWIWGTGSWTSAAVNGPPRGAGRAWPNYLVMSEPMQQDKAAKCVRSVALRLPPGTTHIGLALRTSRGKVEVGMGAAAALDKTGMGWPGLPGKPKWLTGEMECRIDEGAATEDLMREVRRLSVLLDGQRVRTLLDLELVRQIQEK